MSSKRKRDLILISMSLIASNVKGHTKKSTINALYFIAYSAGATIRPQLRQAGNALRYRKGVISSLVFWVIVMILFVLYYVSCKYVNIRRDAVSVGADIEELDNNFAAIIVSSIRPD